MHDRASTAQPIVDNSSIDQITPEIEYSGRRPRILLIAPRYPFPGFVSHNGLTTYARYAAEALRRAGAEVVVIAYRDPRAQACPVEMIDGVAVHRVFIRPLRVFWRILPQVGEGLLLLAAVRRLHQNTEFDAIEGPNVDGQCWAVALRYETFWLRMHTPHWSAAGDAGSDLWAWQTVVARWLDGFTARRAAHRVTHSVVHADTCRETYTLGAKRIHVVPHGIADPGVTDDRRLAKNPRVLAIGVLWRRKGMDLLLMAFERVAADVGDLHLDLVGQPHDQAIQDHLHRLAQEKPLIRDRIRTADRITDAALAELWASATVVVVPSRYESFSFVTIEAMARGIPVIVSDAGALPEVAGPAAMRFHSDDVDSLEGALRELLASRSRQDELGRAGRARFQRYFTLSVMGQNLVSLFTGLTRHTPGDSL